MAIYELFSLVEILGKAHNAYSQQWHFILKNLNLDLYKDCILSYFIEEVNQSDCIEKLILNEALLEIEILTLNDVVERFLFTYIMLLVLNIKILNVCKLSTYHIYIVGLLKKINFKFLSLQRPKKETMIKKMIHYSLFWAILMHF